MTDFSPADHAMGLELQLEELIEQRERAVVQGRTADAQGLDGEIEGVQGELAATAEGVTRKSSTPRFAPEVHNAE